MPSSLPPLYVTPEEEEPWLTGGPAKGVRVRVPAALLVLAAVALLGIWGGAKLGPAPSTTAAGGAPTGLAGGAGRAGGGATGAPTGAFPGGGAATGSAGGRGGFGGTAGTVSAVDGSTVTLTTADGQTVKVTLSDQTTVTRSEAGTTADVKQGDTITVRGTAGADGTTAAQSVTIGALVAGGFTGGPGGAAGQVPTGAPTGQAPTTTAAP